MPLGSRKVGPLLAVSQGPSGVDIAREVGFGVAPESIPGINVLDSGQSGLPINAAIAQVELGVGGPLAVAVQIPDSVSNHIDTMSDDIQKNAASMREIQRLLAGTAGATR